MPDWICSECHKTFEEPRVYIERHGLGRFEGPGERWQVCPYCDSPDITTEVVSCAYCGMLISEDYARLNDEMQWVCPECFKLLEEL